MIWGNGIIASNWLAANSHWLHFLVLLLWPLVVTFKEAFILTSLLLNSWLSRFLSFATEGKLYSTDVSLGLDLPKSNGIERKSEIHLCAWTTLSPNVTFLYSGCQNESFAQTIITITSIMRSSPLVSLPSSRGLVPTQSLLGVRTRPHNHLCIATLIFSNLIINTLAPIVFSLLTQPLCKNTKVAVDSHIENLLAQNTSAMICSFVAACCRAHLPMPRVP